MSNTVENEMDVFIKVSEPSSANAGCNRTRAVLKTKRQQR